MDLAKKNDLIRDAVQTGSNANEDELPVGTTVTGRYRDIHGDYIPFAFIKVMTALIDPAGCWQRNGSAIPMSLRVMSGFLRTATFWDVVA